MESKLFRLKRIKAQIWRFFPVVFLLLSLVLIVLSFSGNSVAYIKQRAVAAGEPVISVISKPVSWFKSGVSFFQNWAQAYHENERLKEENEALYHYR